MKNIYLLITMLFFFSSCIKTVDLNIPRGDDFVYADAWITNEPGLQRIAIRNASAYLGESAQTPVTDATVVLKNLTQSTSYNFLYGNNGYYEHNYTGSPGAGGGNNSFNLLAYEGDTLELTIELDGNVYTARDVMTRVPPIDSITLHYKRASALYEEGVYAEVYITDIAGATDYYWYQTRLNDDPADVGNSLAIDGGFYENMFDGLTFITPLKESINEFGPFTMGDRIYVRLRGISRSTYDFMSILLTASSGGGMFAEILKNVPTNFTTTSGSGKMLGWFAVAAESSDMLNVNFSPVEVN